jgi:hypothetical protein
MDILVPICIDVYANVYRFTSDHRNIHRYVDFMYEYARMYREIQRNMCRYIKKIVYIYHVYVILR